jgi:ankyrin repeat protein
VRTNRVNSVFEDKRPFPKRIETSISDDESESSVEILPNRNLTKTNDRLIFEVLEEGDKNKIVSCVENLLKDYQIEDIVNKQGMSLLHVACQDDKTDIVEYLLEKSITTNKQSHNEAFVNSK